MPAARAILPPVASRSYWSLSRAPRYSLIFAIPLFLLYELLATSLSDPRSQTGVRNAADVLLKTPFVLLSGARGSLVFFATVVAASVYFIGRDYMRSRDRPRWRIFALMFVESAILAGVFGIVVGLLTQRLLGGLSGLAMQGGAIQSMGAGTKLMLSLGAGLYEELLFRVLLVGGMAAGLRWLLGASRSSLVVGTIAACVGALIFSAFHYIGEFGDPFTLASFTYRAVAGLAFSALYLTRGFGITAWTHALYDVYVMVL